MAFAAVELWFKNNNNNMLSAEFFLSQIVDNPKYSNVGDPKEDQSYTHSLLNVI